jgi:MoaA/NifB/PqqE/SkfB family radical SAM enzyme
VADLLQKYRLLRGLCTGDRARTGPFYVTLDVTRRCNLRCLGCRFHSENAALSTSTAPDAQDVRDIPFDMAERLFLALGRLNTRTLFLMGEGEPFLHPRIFDLIGRAGTCGMRTVITTNGTLIDERKARGIIDSGLDEMHVSLWTHSLEGYAKQYPGTDPANFDRVLEGVRTLSDLKARHRSKTPYILLSNPINRLNVRGVDDMVALARETGFDAISFTPFKTNRGALSEYALSDREQSELCNHMLRLRKQIRAQGLGENIGRLLARYEFNAATHGHCCYICWYHSRVKVDGTVRSCGRSDLILGDLKRESFPEIWNGKAYRRERMRMMSPKGFAYRNRICDCEHCSYVQDNLAIHRGFRYALPFVRRSRAGMDEHLRNEDIT